MGRSAETVADLRESAPLQATRTATTCVWYSFLACCFQLPARRRAISQPLRMPIFRGSGWISANNDGFEGCFGICIKFRAGSSSSLFPIPPRTSSGPDTGHRTGLIGPVRPDVLGHVLSCPGQLVLSRCSALNQGDTMNPVGPWHLRKRLVPAYRLYHGVHLGVQLRGDLDVGSRPAAK